MNLQERDLKVLWHPCTQMKDHESLPLLEIKRGEGVYLYDFQDNKYIDAISSWWVNIFGHCNPYINQKIKQQLDTLEHVIAAGCTHQPIVELSERLVKITPGNLIRCFYADSGSASIEIALKMSFHYWQNIGQSQKCKFMSLANGYHGETLGALSVGNVDLFKKTYHKLLLETITLPTPDCFYRNADESWYDYSLRKFYEAEKIIAQHAHETCAIFVEPLVQGAGNMRMYHPIFLTKLRAACTEFNIHLIVDEIATGFGRTGTMFACEQANITPDFLCAAKGLTGGYLPLSVTLTHDKIYQAFYDEYANLNGFLHSHSYTGNPLSCSAALATLDLFEKNNVIANNHSLIQYLHQQCQIFNEHPLVAEVRQTGMIVAIELVKDKKTREAWPWQMRLGLKVAQHALTKGVLLRPTGNVVYFMPPYIITPQQIDTMIAATLSGIEVATQQLIANTCTVS